MGATKSGAGSIVALPNTRQTLPRISRFMNLELWPPDCWWFEVSHILLKCPSSSIFFFESKSSVKSSTFNFAPNHNLPKFQSAGTSKNHQSSVKNMAFSQHFFPGLRQQQGAQPLQRRRSPALALAPGRAPQGGAYVWSPCYWITTGESRNLGPPSE